MPQPTSGLISHWEKIDRLINHSVEPMAPEWFTTKQFAKRYGLGEATSYRKLMDLMEDGKIECWYGISFVNRRMMRKWRLKTKKNAATELPQPEQAGLSTDEVFPALDSESGGEAA